MTSILNYPHIGILILAWFLADLVIPMLVISAHRIGFLDRPGGHKGHAQAIPFVGGLGILIAFAVALGSTIRLGDLTHYVTAFEYFWSGPGRPLAGIVVGAAIVFLMGLIDDIRPLHAVLKLAILFGATSILHASGVSLTLFPAEIGGVPTGWLNLPLTCLWVAGVTSATNSLDNMDGALGGPAAIAAAATFYVAWGASAATAQPWLSFVACALFGSCLGFLRYNFAPARVFLGDSGSMLLGFLLASMLVLGDWSTIRVKAIAIPCMFLTVPLYDLVLSTCLRCVHGRVRNPVQAITYCGRDHITHRFLALGYTVPQVSLILWLIAALAAILAVILWKEQRPMGIGLILTAWVTGLVCLALWLDRAPVYDEPDTARPQPAPATVGEEQDQRPQR